MIPAGPTRLTEEQKAKRSAEFFRNLAAGQRAGGAGQASKKRFEEWQERRRKVWRTEAQTARAEIV